VPFFNDRNWEIKRWQKCNRKRVLTSLQQQNIRVYVSDVRSGRKYWY